MVLLIVAVVLVVGGSIAARMLRPEAAPSVTVGPAVTQTITEMVSASGKIQPEVEVKISPEVAGEILELPFREGAKVRKGELLVRIKSDNYQFQVDQREADLAATRASAVDAKARLLKAQEDLQRTQRLHTSSLISDSELLAAQTAFESASASHDSALANIRRAEGSLRQAQDQLEKCTIYAPIDGTISALMSEVGERVAGTGQYGGAEIMRVADLANMEVRVNVNENDIVNVKIGDRTHIGIDAYPDVKFSGTVTEIASTALTEGQNTQEQVTNFEVRIRIDSTPERLRPGMSADADIETRTAENVVAVPIQAVTVRSREEAKTIADLTKEREAEMQENRTSGGAVAIDESKQRQAEEDDRDSLQRVVFVVQDDAVVMQAVETGIADQTHMEIKSGVKEGDRVVTGPFSVVTRTLKDDMKVTVSAPKQAADK